MSTHPLLDVAVKAAGGLERWHRVREIQATVSSGGLAFLGRLRGAKRHLKISASPVELRAVLTQFPSAGHRGMFDRSGVRIETENGHVVQQREDARPERNSPAISHLRGSSARPYGFRTGGSLFRNSADRPPRAGLTPS
jgi:hypothetical protein